MLRLGFGSSRNLVYWPIRMYEHFRVPFNAFVKLLISDWRFVDVNFVRNDETWLRFA